MGLYECIKSYDSDSGNLFLTYAAPAIRNAMFDYIRSQSSSFKAKHLNHVVSLDEMAQEESHSNGELYSGPTAQTPEQIYLTKETYEELHYALEQIKPRETAYLEYRFGFDDDEEHPLTETAEHFRLSESRAKSTEKLALKHVRRALNW